MTPTVFAVMALAVYRLTILLVADEITATPRHALLRRFNERAHRRTKDVRTGDGTYLAAECSCGFSVVAPPEGPADPLAVIRALDDHVYEHVDEKAHPKLAVLVDCPWCVSIWLGFPSAWATVAWSSGWGWWVVAGALASSAVAGFAASFASP